MLNDTEIDLIRHARHGDPFSVLGPHADLDGRLWLRAFLPGATHVVAVEAADGATLVPLLLVHVDGLFEGALLALPASGYRLQVRWADGNQSVIDDPYRFPPVLGELDVWLMGEGTHLRPYEVLGATQRTLDGAKQHTLHPLDGAPAYTVADRDVEALVRAGFIASNLKFPAATYVLL